jgi:hypothetical protein
MESKIFIPSSLNDITLEQYQLFMKLRNDEDSEEITARKMISTFCKIPLSQVLNIEYSSIKEILENFDLMFSETPELTTTFKLGGVEFGFITNIEQMSFGEYIDTESYLDKWETMHSAMAVLYRPITKKIKGGKYEIEKYISAINYSEVMKALPLDIVFGVNVFFWNLGRELLVGLMGYSAQQLTTKEKTILAKQLNLANGGAGIKAYMDLQKETLLNSTKLPHYR